MSNLLITFIGIMVFIITLIILYSTGILQKMFPYLKDGFSIDETKVSVFIITFVITFGLIIYSFFVFGDIPPNLLNFAIGLITAITGINVVAKAVQLKQNQTVNQIMETTEEIMNSSTNISEK